MKFFAILATLALAASTAVAQLMINTPSNAVVCQPLLFTWTDGSNHTTFLSLVSGNDPTGSPILNFGQVTGTSFTWIVNVTAGTSLVLDLRDGTGMTVQSAPFTTIAGNDNSCLSGSASNSASTAGNTSPPASTAPSSPSASTGVASSTAISPASASGTSSPSSAASSPSSLSSAASSPSSPSSAASSPSTSSNAGPTQAANFGAAALLGAAAVALLA